MRLAGLSLRSFLPMPIECPLSDERPWKNQKPEHSHGRSREYSASLARTADFGLYKGDPYNGMAAAAAFSQVPIFLHVPRFFVAHGRNGSSAGENSKGINSCWPPRARSTAFLGGGQCKTCSQNAS